VLNGKSIQDLTRGAASQKAAACGGHRQVDPVPYRVAAAGRQLFSDPVENTGSLAKDLHALLRALAAHELRAKRVAPWGFCTAYAMRPAARASR
jgi:hypothetical protein